MFALLHPVRAFNSTPEGGTAVRLRFLTYIYKSFPALYNTETFYFISCFHLLKKEKDKIYDEGAGFFFL